MVRAELTVEDIQKLKKAYDRLDSLLALADSAARLRGETRKTHSFIDDAHRLLGEVLYGVTP